MVAFTATIYSDPADVKTVVDAIENTVIIHVLSFMENGKQKFMVIT